jgi:plastocyanin
VPLPVRAAASVAFVVVFAVAALAARTGATAASVAVVDFEFTPARSAAVVGQAVSWEWGDQLNAPHNVQEDHKLFRSGALTSDATTVFSRRPSAGTYHYFCTAHGSPVGGMAGTVAVSPTTSDGPAGAAFAVGWATSTQTGTVFDVRYRTAGGAWAAWRTDTGAFGATFGRRDRPVAVVPGEIYEIQVRSQADAASPRRVSGWSPSATYTAP